MSDGQQGSFEHETFLLPDGVPYLYVAFWMDDGEGDYGKTDNVVVSAVPEPGTLGLLALGVTALAALRRRS
jgi:PEP-CTERM motif